MVKPGSEAVSLNAVARAFGDTVAEAIPGHAAQAAAANSIRDDLRFIDRSFVTKDRYREPLTRGWLSLRVAPWGQRSAPRGVPSQGRSKSFDDKAQQADRKPERPVRIGSLYINRISGL